MDCIDAIIRVWCPKWRLDPLFCCQGWASLPLYLEMVRLVWLYKGYTVSKVSQKSLRWAKVLQLCSNLMCTVCTNLWLFFGAKMCFAVRNYWVFLHTYLMSVVGLYPRPYGLGQTTPSRLSALIPARLPHQVPTLLRGGGCRSRVWGIRGSLGMWTICGQRQGLSLFIIVLWTVLALLSLVSFIEKKRILINLCECERVWAVSSLVRCLLINKKNYVWISCQ